MKKFISLILALAMVMLSIPSIALAEQQVTVETDISKVQDLASRTNSDENIVKNFGIGSNQVGGMVNVIKNTPSDGETTTLPDYISVSGFNATNGIINEKHNDYNVPFLDSEGNWTGNTIDIVFNLMGEAKINAFLFAGCNESNNTLYTEEYAIFASDEFATLYNDSNKIYHYENTAKTGAQYFSFSEEIEAKYFGIRIYKGVTQDLSAKDRPYSGARIRELAIFGTCENVNDKDPDSFVNATVCINSLKSSSNLSSYIKANTTENPPKNGTFLVLGNDGEGIKTGATHNYATDNDIIDGNVATHSDINVRNADGFILNMRQNGDVKEYIDEVYYDIVLSLAGSSEVEKIFLAHHAEEGLRTYEYEIYISETYESLFNSANKKFAYVNEKKSQYQTFVLDEAQTASFVGVRILKALPLDTSYGVETAYPRIAEIAVFGKYDAPIPEFDPDIIDSAVNNLSKSQLATEYNLAADITNTTEKANIFPGYMNIIGYDNSTEGKAGAVHNYRTENDILDLNADSHSDIGAENAVGQTIVFMEEVGGVKKFKSGVHIDINLALRESAKIEKFFISHHSSESLRTYEYEVYMSDSFETLYNASNKVIYYINESKARYQTFVLEEPVKASFVGVRILKAVPSDATNAVSLLYPRIGEIAVFGEYENGVNYSVKAPSVGINASGKVYQGKDKSFSFPLVSNGLSFKGVTVNGSPAEATIYQFKNEAVLKLNLTEDVNIEATYESTPSSLIGSPIKNGYIRLPKNISIALKSSFKNQYASAVSIKNGGAELNDTDYVATGNKISVGSSVSYDVITEFDYDLNGNSSVTDLVAAIDGVLENDANETEIFSFDADENDKLTVSDLVAGRKNILSTKDVDYSQKTLTMDKVPFKGLGRYELSEGVVNLEMTASGFSFNAYCFGDIKLNVKNGNYLLRYAVYLDGVRQDDLIVLGGTNGDIVLFESLSFGYHNIEIIKQFETTRSTDFKAITLTGEFGEKPQNKDLLIEFVGDSITCGYGNLIKNGQSAVNHEDSTKTYGFYTAQALNADWAMISRSGATVVDVTQYDSNVGCMPKDYEKCSTNSELNWSFERKADIVVINLGTNDNSKIPTFFGTTTEEEKKTVFKDTMKAFTRRVYELNGNDVKIVYAFGLMSPAGNHEWAVEAYQELVEEFSSEGFNVYFKRLTARQNGGDAHPDANDAYLASQELVEFIQSNVLAN